MTGGAGFIGSHLARELLERGYHVRVLDNLSTGKPENLEGLKVELIESDIRQLADVQHAMKSAEAVFHHAAMISVAETVEDPLNCYETNLLGSVNLLEAARVARPKAIIMASSAAVYGSVQGMAAETEYVNPLSPYAASKLAMEQACQQYSLHFELNILCLRYFNIYGPRQSADSPYAAVIPRFLEAVIRQEAPTIYGDGEQRRDFAYVADAVQANLLALGKSDAQGQPVNISGGSPISIRELAALLQRIEPEWPDPEFAATRPGDVRFSAANLELARSYLGYHPEVDLERGLQETLKWFRRRSEDVIA